MLYKITHLFRVPYKIQISGQNCSSPAWCGQLYISSAYSDTFNAILDYIIKNIDKSNNVQEIKELYSNSSINNKDGGVSHFIVSQQKEFVIDKDVFITIINRKEDHEGNKKSYQIENITIELFSYKYTLVELKQYLDNIVSNYKKTIQNDRTDKQFIYSVDKITLKDDESNCDMWKEEEYVSNRQFDNLFFENKSDILSKIDFFINNKKWYDNKGIPYNLGIGLHGPPGTGKTSFIKALANKTKRDIVIIPLKLITTTSQLKTVFFENTYNRCNVKNSKSFDKKIIVFEDIDCIGDIIKNRKDLANSPVNNSPVPIPVTFKQDNRASDESTELSKLTKCLEASLNTSTCMPKMSYADPVTLDDFLNLWDGVRETPGRIIIITSNHYNQLDPALIRPGRIDISYELTNVSHETLQEMHFHFFQKYINPPVIKKIKPYFYSPAELVNIFLSNKCDEMAYLKRLILNKKV
jgi:ATP-dependent Zn protease